MSPARVAFLILLVCATRAGADEQGATGARATEPVAQSGGHGIWSASLDAYLYLQEEDDFLMPIVAADRGRSSARSCIVRKMCAREPSAGPVGRAPREARPGGASRTSADDVRKSAADGALWAWPTSLLP